jgi:hypothetical protein
MATSWWPWATEKKQGLLLGAATIVVAIMGIVHNDLRAWFYRPPRCGKLIASKNFIDFQGSDTYISQPALEKELDLFIGRPGKEYIVVNGPKGAGKSTVVHAALSRQPYGALAVSLQSYDIDVYTILANDICGKDQVWKLNEAASVLQDSIQIVRGRTGLIDWVPTLVVEIDRAPSDVAVHQTARDIKLLCVDKSVCRGIIVLSDALAVLALPNDPRVELLWVDDFSINQANLYFDSLGYLKGDDASACPSTAKDCAWNSTTMREIIFAELGTRPIDLIRLIDKTRHDVSLIDGYISHRKEECERQLMALFASRESPSGQEFEYLAREILKSSTLGVKASRVPRATLFTNVERGCVVLKAHHAMLFHSPTGTYRFASKCIANAAVEWHKTQNV